ncbi:uncharacterized protein LOC132730607 [Ruditapes philippinarum]|uniref:uncharacterized protein LOC132730607 n=1 Tax=Ruditapes philippinarum TaxID=129788 RepID=UPI00295C0FA9|nr:uncharacterized protein LOC132730607 [Ruditapes philippinarum]
MNNIMKSMIMMMIMSLWTISIRMMINLSRVREKMMMRIIIVDFKNMAKRFKTTETCDSKVDSVLASTVNDLFLNGLDEDHYNKLTKDELNARPENCEALSVVKMNQLIWDAVSPNARTSDRKLQYIEESVIKSGTLLVKVVNELDKLDSENDGKLGPLIEQCNDVLALLGHANKQINMTRKDFLRPEMSKEYTHLCSQSRPFTKFLFGDDVSKSAKEIEDCSKISNKMFDRRPFRGGPARRMLNRGFRFRGGYGRGMRPRGRGLSDPNVGTSTDSKNYQRRGSRLPFKQ